MQGKPAPFSIWSEEFLEDCLYLNVWSGASSAWEKRPVLVWIYGGGFSSGGSAVTLYDGEYSGCGFIGFLFGKMTEQ